MHGIRLYCLWFYTDFNNVFCTLGLIFWELSLAVESIIFWHWCVGGKLLSPLSVRSKADLSSLEQVVSHHLCRPRLLDLEHPPFTWCLLPHTDLKGYDNMWYEIRNIGPVEAGATWAVSILFCEQLRNVLGGTHSGECLTLLWVQISAKGESSVLCHLSCILSICLAPLTFLLQQQGLGEWRSCCFTCLERSFPASYLSLEK